MTGEEIKVIPEEIAVCLSADMRGGRETGSFLTACRLYLKQRRREQMESVREFYQRLGEGHGRLTPCESKLTWLNADEDVWRSTEEGEHFLLGEGGEIKAGFGGKFTGKKPSEVWGEGKQAATGALQSAPKSGIMNTGGKSGALDRDSNEAITHAKSYYQEVRNRKPEPEIKAISENTGFSEEQVADIRRHMFFDEIRFETGELKRFDPDYDQAVAWQRLRDGNFSANDVLLLNHELEEIRYMREHKAFYEEAHRHANEKYNWQNTLK